MTYTVLIMALTLKGMNLLLVNAEQPGLEMKHSDERFVPDGNDNRHAPIR